MRLKDLINLSAELANNQDFAYGGVKEFVTRELIAETQRTICKERRWSWLLKTTTFNTVAGQEEYLLPKDLREIYTIIEGSTPDKLTYISQDDFDILRTLSTEQGIPTHYRLFGRRNDIYNIGTVSINTGSKNLTGAGTNWNIANNIYPYQRITLDNSKEVYTIANIVNITSIILHETAITTVVDSTYSIKVDNEVVRFYPIPEREITITLRYFQEVLDLRDDEDESIIPDNTILAYGAAMLIKAKNEENTSWLSNIYQKMLRDMRKQDEEKFDHLDTFVNALPKRYSIWDPFQV